MAAAQTAPAAGIFSGSMLVPGTNTSLKIGGYVKLDYTYDFSAQENIVGGLNPGAIPLDANVPGTTASPGRNIHGASQMTASESRFNIETRTPTSYGEVKTFIEGDFFNPNGLVNSNSFKVNSNSSGFELRYAYGTLGPWLIGQFNSVFRDTFAEAETLDYNGPISGGVFRQPLVRYLYAAGSGLEFVLAAENPQTFWTEATGTATLGGTTNTTFGTGQGDKVPDFTASATLNAPWGHVALRGVFRDLYDHNGTTISQSKFGWGLGLSANLDTGGKDDLIVQVNGGEGVGRYMNTFSPLVPDAVVNTATNRMTTIAAVGGLLGYQHWWSSTLRSTVVGSYLRELNPSGAFAPAALAVQGKYWWTGTVNLIWSPVPQIDTGIEYIHENRTIENGQRGDINRAQLSARFHF
jgi:hypothetical protein